MIHKPTIDEIKTVAEKDEKTYGPLWGKYETDAEFYELKFGGRLRMPVEFEEDATVLPTARDMLDTFVDHIDLSNARVSVNKRGEQDIDETRAEMMRRIYLGILYRTNIEADISQWRVGGKHYALHGSAILKTVYIADMWPDKPVQKDEEKDDHYAERMKEWEEERGLTFPILLQAINPANVMFDPHHVPALYVIERGKKSRLAAEMLWPHWKNVKGRGADEDVEYLFYWDNHFRCDLVDGEPILKVKGGVAKHPYGFIPYTLIESGLGNHDREGKPETRYVGSLRYMYDVLVSESRSYSINDAVLKKTAWPWGYLRVPQDVAPPPTLDQSFGTYTPMDDRIEIKDMTPQVPPRALMEHFMITSDIIGGHAAPRSLRGMGETGVRSAADRRLMLAEAGMRYQYSRDAFRYGAARILIKMAKIIKNVLPYEIQLWATDSMGDVDVKVKKEDMKEPFTCHIEWAPISEEDEYRRHDDLERLYNTGLVTKRWARGQMPNVNPIAMEDEEEREKIMNDPNLQAFVIQEGIQGLMGGGLPQPGMEASQMGNLTTGIPNRALPGSAEEAQLGLKQLRSQTPLFPGQGQGGGGAPRRT